MHFPWEMQFVLSHPISPHGTFPMGFPWESHSHGQACEYPANEIQRSDNKAHSTTAAAVCSPSGTDSPTVNVVYSAEEKKRLQVVPVCISNETTGKSKNTLALLDSGADTHHLTKRLYLDLGLDGRPIRLSLQLADGSVRVTDTVEVKCIVRSVQEKGWNMLEGKRVVGSMPDLSGSMPSSINLTQDEHLSNLDIPTFDTDAVDLIIGIGSTALHIVSEVRQGG